MLTEGEDGMDKWRGGCGYVLDLVFDGGMNDWVSDFWVFLVLVEG